MDVGPIPWSAVVDYADRLGLAGVMHRTFCAVLRAMDDAWLAEQRKTAPEAPAMPPDPRIAREAD